jgi:hypothetical protein
MERVGPEDDEREEDDDYEPDLLGSHRDGGGDGGISSMG